MFCNKLFEKGQKCLMCTRMTCRIKKHSYTLKQLDSVSINELVADAPDDLKNVFELLRCENKKSVLPMNFFIDHAKLNSFISDEPKSFYDINPLGTNHPPLVYVDFLTVASKVTVKYLYWNLTKKWGSGFLVRPLEEPLHDVHVCLIVTTVQALCNQYIKKISYQGFLNIFDNLSPNEVND